MPPGTGICHQVNLEYLARVVEDRDGVAFPDTLVGTDSHTTMVNGLGVLGWGVGGIEAEAAMLGQPLSMLVPQVVGFKLSGSLPEGATATDLVLTVTEILRKTGVVGKFVEYFGDGVASLPLADRATLGNMSPEYGATCGFFPVDDVTLDYLRLTGRPAERIALVEAYCKENMLWHDPSDHATYSQVVELDLGDVEPSIAGPRRPQDRVPLARAKTAFVETLGTFGVDYGNGDEAVADTFPASDPTTEQQPGGEVLTDTAGVATAEHVEPHHSDVAGTDYGLDHGSVVIAAITSCTNTSNPQVMVAAGLLARNAVAKGISRKPWVKSSLAPGSKVVTRYYEQAGLDVPLDELGFNTVGYGCTTCIGNSGPLADEISAAITEGDLVVCSVLSGNRNFEARIHPEVKANYLASPPLVVAYALAGRMDIDFETEPIEGDVYLRDIWPSAKEIERHDRHLGARRALLRDVRRRLHRRRRMARAAGSGRRAVRVAGRLDVRAPAAVLRGDGARARHGLGHRRRALPRLARRLGDDRPHLARRLDPARLAGRQVPHRSRRRAQGLQLVRRAARQPRGDGARHVRERAAAQQARRGGGTWTVHVPSGEEMTIFEASERYLAEGTPLVVLAGKEYGSGSSRDWAAKGPNLLGVKAVIAESYERIHRSNLLMMGILPLQFLDGETPESLGLTGRESFSVVGVDNGDATEVTVRADDKEFRARVRLDTPRERDYLRHGGILPYVLRRLLSS